MTESFCMCKKIIVHTDASNIINSNICRTSSIIEYMDNTTTIVDYFAGKINQAELFVVLKTLETIEKDYQPDDFIIEVYTDHLPNTKLLDAIMLADNKSEKDIVKINRILTRKGLVWQDVDIIFRLCSNNKLIVIWIPRNENKVADKLSKLQ